MIKSGLIVLSVAAIAGYGTYSFFSDTETSTGNNFTAGSIDLKVDSQATYNGASYPAGTWGQDSPGVDITNQKFFDFADLKPGDEGENTISLHVINNDARACVIFDKMKSDDNGITEPESKFDTTGGIGQGELAQELNVFAWDDLDGDNIWESGEYPLFANPFFGPASDVLSGKAYDLGTLTGATTKYLGLYWCYGTISGIENGTLNCSGSAVTNISQSDSLIGDVWFYIEQARNNDNFACPAPRNNGITANDIESSSLVSAKTSGRWFFYNDTNDTIMSINQFSGTAGIDDIVAGPGSTGAAQMTLDSGVNPRYNIATYRYNDVKLSGITSLKYRIYDIDSSNGTPFLNFNIDFNNTDIWQKRLVQVPVGLVSNTWTTVDALTGSWTYSGATWPIGLVDVTGTTPGTTVKTWAQILADYPNAETRSTDSWLGVRVGQPGPSGDTGYVDWIDFNGEISDFSN